MCEWLYYSDVVEHFTITCTCSPWAHFSPFLLPTTQQGNFSEHWPTSQHLFHFYPKDIVFGASKHHAKHRSVVEGGVNMVTAYIFFSSLFSHFSNALIKCFTQCDFVSRHPWIVSGMRHVDKKERREKEERKDKEAKSVAFSLLFQALFNIKLSLLNL